MAKILGFMQNKTRIRCNEQFTFSEIILAMMSAPTPSTRDSLAQRLKSKSITWRLVMETISGSYDLDFEVELYKSATTVSKKAGPPGVVRCRQTSVWAKPPHRKTEVHTNIKGREKRKVNETPLKLNLKKTLVYFKKRLDSCIEKNLQLHRCWHLIKRIDTIEN